MVPAVMKVEVPRHVVKVSAVRDDSWRVVVVMRIARVPDVARYPVGVVAVMRSSSPIAVVRTAVSGAAAVVGHTVTEVADAQAEPTRIGLGGIDQGKGCEGKDSCAGPFDES